MNIHLENTEKFYLCQNDDCKNNSFLTLIHKEKPRDIEASVPINKLT